VQRAGILAFAERILPHASDLWVQASLDYKQRLQQLFFPEGIAYDGNRFNRTAATAPLFSYLAPSESADEKMVRREGIEPSRELTWLRSYDLGRSRSCASPISRRIVSIRPSPRSPSNRGSTLMANTLAALDAGVSHVESAFGGVGGCPFTAVTGGNLCTEDFAYYLQRSGRRTDVTLDRLVSVAARRAPSSDERYLAR